MPGSTLTRAQRDRYHAARREGAPAEAAYCHAVSAATPWDMTYDLDVHGVIHFDTSDVPDLAGLEITAVAEPDPAPDLSWLGEFSNRWAPDALIIDGDHSHRYRYFHPTYTALRRRADLSARGYSRGVAEYLARQQTLDDLRLTTELEVLIVTVTVAKAGIALGNAVLGDVTLDSRRADVDQLVELISVHLLVDEAVDDARTALRTLTEGDRSEPPPEHDAVVALDPDSLEGAAILDLFIRIKRVEEPDGVWPGADVVEHLLAWLLTVGIDLDESPDQVLARLCDSAGLGSRERSN